VTQRVAFDPLAPAQQDDPYAVYALARREQPVFHAERFGIWVVTRYDDVLAVLKDHRTFSSAGALRSRRAPHPPEVEAVLREGHPDMPYIIDADPPLHDRIRGLVTRAFTPRRVAALEPAIASIARELLDELAPDRRADLIERFAWPLPLRVLGEMLGVPAGDLPQLHRWGLDWLTLYQDAPADEQLEHARGLVELQRYFVATLDRREREPTDDLMSALLDANRADPLPLEVVAGVPLDLVVAGHVTVTRAIGSAVVLLLGRPGGMAAVEEDAGQVVEEILRLESPAQGLFRTTTREVELGGVTLPAGARVMAHFGSANRDDAVFAEPDRFDPSRPDLSRSVAFGKGIHFCIGAPLARLELGIALPELARRLPGLRLAPDGRREREPIFFARGFRSLDVEWDPD
jgi:cytochrome P450